MKKLSIYILLGALALTGTSAFAKETGYKGRFSARGEVGIQALTSAKALAGFGNQGGGDDLTAAIDFRVPIWLSGSYGITNALEVNLSLGYGIAAHKANLDVPNGFSIGGGLRYYFNESDPVKFFFGTDFAVQLMELTIHPSLEYGFIWDFAEDMSVYYRGMGGLIAYKTSALGGKPHYSVGINLQSALGFQYRF